MVSLYRCMEKWAPIWSPKLESETYYRRRGGGRGDKLEREWAEASGSSAVRGAFTFEPSYCVLNTSGFFCLNQTVLWLFRNMQPILVYSNTSVSPHIFPEAEKSSLHLSQFKSHWSCVWCPEAIFQQQCCRWSVVLHIVLVFLAITMNPLGIMV